jgi:CCR4-NOT transcriptional regulation complex NOT5 subunit
VIGKKEHFRAAGTFATVSGPKNAVFTQVTITENEFNRVTGRDQYARLAPNATFQMFYDDMPASLQGQEVVIREVKEESVRFHHKGVTWQRFLPHTCN